MSYKKLGTIPLPDLLLLLRDKAPELFAEIKPRTDHTKGVNISQALAAKIDDFLVSLEPPQHTHGFGIPQGTQQPVPPKPKPEPWVDPFHKETAELIEREGKRIRRERAAQARLEYWQSQGLLDNKANADAIVNFIKEHNILKGRFNQASVDIAIDWLGPKGSNVLQWRPKVVAPPPAPPPKPWKPGDPLPDSATEYQLRHSSLADMKAWKRRKQGK
jgi:hypothetical protein